MAELSTYPFALIGGYCVSNYIGSSPLLAFSVCLITDRISSFAIQALQKKKQDLDRYISEAGAFASVIALNSALSPSLSEQTRLIDYTAKTCAGFAIFKTAQTAIKTVSPSNCFVLFSKYKPIRYGAEAMIATLVTRNINTYLGNDEISIAFNMGLTFTAVLGSLAQDYCSLFKKETEETKKLNTDQYLGSTEET